MLDRQARTPSTLESFLLTTFDDQMYVKSLPIPFPITRNSIKLNTNSRYDLHQNQQSYIDVVLFFGYVSLCIISAYLRVWIIGVVQIGIQMNIIQLQFTKSLFLTFQEMGHFSLQKIRFAFLYFLYRIDCEISYSAYCYIFIMSFDLCHNQLIMTIFPFPSQTSIRFFSSSSASRNLYSADLSIAEYHNYVQVLKKISRNLDVKNLINFFVTG